MTFLEKAMQEHAGLNEGKIVTWMCPCDFGYEKMEDGCNAAAGDDEKKTCWECWNRQADAAGGGESQPVCSVAVEKCEEEREPEAFFGNRKAVREAPEGKTDCHTSAAALARNDSEGGPDDGG